MSYFQQYSDRAWGLLRTTSKSEQYVLSYFTGYNIPCYLPHIRKVISKNKSTMEAARRLYGITREESGVSKVMSVNLSDRADAAKKEQLEAMAAQ